MEQFDFNEPVTLHSDILTTYNKKLLILKNVTLYDGPVTLQYLPYGGIQSTFNYNLIINSKNGFITCEYVIYDGHKLSLFEFINKNKNLINTILPN